MNTVQIRRAGLVGALVVPALVAAVLGTVRDSVPSSDAALVLVLVVVGFAATGSRTAGVVAALSSTVWFDFFLTRPFTTFTIDSRDDVETAVLLTVVGLVVTEVALWGRRQQARQSRTAGYLDGVVSASTMAGAGVDGPEAVATYVASHVCDVLDADDARFVAGPVASDRPRLERDGTLVHAGHHVDVERDGMPVFDVVAVPVAHGGTTYGAIEVGVATRVVRPSLAHRRIALALADQAAAAFASARTAARPPSEPSVTSS